jgi:hypothetical protein
MARTAGAKTTQKQRQKAESNSLLEQAKRSLSPDPYGDVLTLQGMVGNGAVNRLLQEGRSAVVQAKLTIGQPGDKYEQEADRVAEEVMRRMNNPQSEALQCQSLPNEEDKQQYRKPTTQNPISFLHPISAGDGLPVSPSLETAIQHARGSGEALPGQVRKPMEQAFGADFSGVKVHTDNEADRLSCSIQANAFTIGQDIFFKKGECELGSQQGQELLTHELAHVVQQTGNAIQPTLQRRILIGQRRYNWITFIDDMALGLVSGLNRGDSLRVLGWSEEQRERARRIILGMDAENNEFTFDNAAIFLAEIERRAELARIETPTEEERRQLIVISELARLPHYAHHRWESLNEGQRGAVLWEMGRNYGSDFVQQFRQYAEAGHFENSVNYTNWFRLTGEGFRVPLTAYHRLATEEGFKFAGAGFGLLHNDELWVHPSGRRIQFIPGRESIEGGSEVTEEIGEQTEEEVLREEEADELTEIWTELWRDIHGALGEGRSVTVRSDEGTEFRITQVYYARTLNEYRFVLNGFLPYSLDDLKRRFDPDTVTFD